MPSRASLPIGLGLANLVRFTRVSLATSLNMASLHPARLMGREPYRLRVGGPADLVLFDLPPAAFTSRAATHRFDARATLSAGRVVFGEVAS